MDGTLDFVREQVAAGRRVALVSVTGSAGSSPASEGQAMAVLADGTARGTVGGGACEERLRLAAVEAIRSGRKTFEFFFDLAETGMVCGGSVKGYGHIFGDERRLLIFGGGHISQCLAPLALSAGFAVRVVDDRPEFAERFPGIPYLACPPE
ncbi:MAG: XdhC family protein, partial [Treponema sp.]|nr:XdhC family protein [Treponema sp.]